MSIEGWKNFPTPNPWFEVSPKADVIYRLTKFTSLGLVVMYVLALASFLLFGFLELSQSQNAAGAMAFLAWLALWPSIMLYRKSGYEYLASRAEIIPAYTDKYGESIWFVLLLRLPIFLFGCTMGLLGGILLGLERRGKTDIGISFIVDGCEHRTSTLVRADISEEMLDGVSVWITTPSFLLPPVAVDRYGHLGVLDNCTIEADEWFDAALDRAESREENIKELKRRARAIKEHGGPELKHAYENDPDYFRSSAASQAEFPATETSLKTIARAA